MVPSLPATPEVVRQLPRALAGWFPPSLYMGLSLLSTGRTRMAYVPYGQLVGPEAWVPGGFWAGGGIPLPPVPSTLTSSLRLPW